MSSSEHAMTLFGIENTKPLLVNTKPLLKKAHKLPRPRKVESGCLFHGAGDVRLSGYRHGAVVIGDFFEEASLQLLSDQVERLITDSSSEVCPDLQEVTRREFFIESKGMQHGRHVNIYEHATSHYENLLAMYFPDTSILDPDWNPSLLFFFWVHQVYYVDSFKWKEDLRDALAQSIETLYVFDFPTVKQFIRNKRVEDYSGVGYRPFRRIRLGDFKGIPDNWAAFMEKHELPISYRFLSGSSPSVNVYGRTCNAFPMHVLIDKDTISKPSVSRFLRDRRIVLV